MEKIGLDAKHQEVLNNSDLSKFQEMYKGFGLELEVKVQTEGEVFVGYCVDLTARTGYNKKNDTYKVDGYGGFYVRHLFDKNGKFIGLGIWE